MTDGIFWQQVKYLLDLIELRKFKCTPIKTGQVWQLGYFFYKYKVLEHVGIAVSLDREFVLKNSEQLNLFWKYKNTKSSLRSFVQHKHFLVLSFNFENIPVCKKKPILHNQSEVAKNA